MNVNRFILRCVMRGETIDRVISRVTEYLREAVVLKVVSIVIAFLNFACSSLETSRVEKIPLESFFKNPIAGQFRISPDGQNIAALRPYRKRFNVFVRKTSGKKWSRLTSVTDRDIASITWKGNDIILYQRDFGGDENYHVFSVNIKTKRAQDLTPFKNTKVRLIDDLSGISKDHVLISMNKRSKSVFDVYKLNVNSGEFELIEKNPGNYTGWVVDHKGRVRIAIATDGVNYTMYFKKNGAKKFQKIRSFGFKESFYPLFFAADNYNVYAHSNLGRNTKAFVLVNPETLKEKKVIYKNKRYDVGSLKYSKRSKRLISASYTSWKRQQHFFSSKYKKIHNDIQAQLKNKEIYLTSHNKAETLFTVYAGSDRSRGQYYIYDFRKRELKHLLDPSPWLPEDQMAEVKPITYKSRDGLTIEGYLTLPKGQEAKKLPVIVNPHGGPWARDYWGFNSEVQFLASRGYAVLQMNFRGSTGYGKRFWTASFKQWGRKMQDDITDGVKWLVGQGIADADRICIYGASYGGYATLAGLTYTPDLYRCGVDYVGVSNLLTFMKTIPPYWKPYLQMLYEQVGNPNDPKDKKMLIAASPYYNADKIKAPLFVVQGAKDPRVKKSESDQIVSALRKKGVDVPYLVKENEGHGFRNEENRLEFYRKMEKFLEKHNPAHP